MYYLKLKCSPFEVVCIKASFLIKMSIIWSGFHKNVSYFKSKCSPLECGFHKSVVFN